MPNQAETPPQKFWNWRSFSAILAQAVSQVFSGSCSAERGFAPGLHSSSRSILARTDGVFRYVRLPRRVERSSSQDRLFERVYGYAVVRTLVLLIYHPIVSSLLLSFLFLHLRLPLRPAGRLLSLCAVRTEQHADCIDVIIPF